MALFATETWTMRHRLLLTFEAEADGVTTDDFIRRLLEVVAVP